MHNVWIGHSNLVNSLRISRGGFPRVVFATLALGKTLGFLRSFYLSFSQLFTHKFLLISRYALGFLPTFHRHNNDYNKGE